MSKKNIWIVQIKEIYETCFSDSGHVYIIIDKHLNLIYKINLTAVFLVCETSIILRLIFKSLYTKFLSRYKQRYFQQNRFNQIN